MGSTDVLELAGAPVDSRGTRALVVGSVASSFLGAFLLFQLEPMVAKMLLPSLGGSAAVWNTAMVFFQVALVTGYALAHLTLRALRPARHVALQAALLVGAFLALPLAVPAGWEPPVGGDPVGWTLLACLAIAGAPFVVLATTGPTLQRWFSFTDHPRASDPYFLYAAGNAGSLLALLSYPLLVEPNLPLSEQATIWTVLYVVFGVITIATGVGMLRYRATPAAAPAEARPVVALTARRQLWWVGLAAIPSALMLGVTRHLATDIASVPLLWVIPLALYLLTFILAFGGRSAVMVGGAARALRLLAIPLALTFIGVVPSLWIQLPIQLGAFTAAALLAHARLAQDRPAADQLTRYFLLVALGGAAGGIFAGLVAPVVFTAVLEYPIAFVAALAVIPVTALGARAQAPVAVRAAVAVGLCIVAFATVALRSDGSQRSLTVSMVVAACGLGAAFVLTRRPVGFAAAVAVVVLAAVLVPANPTLFVDRTFYGVHRVYAESGTDRHVLLNGTTVHGIQNVRDGVLSDRPTAYYSAGGPLADVMGVALQGGPRRLAVIGAGAGSVASYLRPGDAATFYEIDEAVVRIATDPELFSYVRDTAGDVDFVLGDGRLELARSATSYDVVMVDAFSGDAIPTHLLTTEAVALYLQRAGAHGVAVFNVSNRYFDLRPVLARIAAAQGLTAFVRADPASTPGQQADGALASTWVVVARAPGDLGGLTSAPGWEPLMPDEGAPLWTDDYTDVLRTMVGR